MRIIKKNFQQKNDSDLKWYSVITSFITAHPFIYLGIICFFSISVTTGEKITPVIASVPAVAVFFASLIGVMLMTEKMSYRSRKPLRIILTAAALYFSFAFGFLLTDSKKPELLILNLGMFVLLCLTAYFGVTKKLNTHNAVMLIFAAGFLIRLAYVMSIMIQYKQHDVGSIEKMNGHLGYIAYIYYNNRLPEIDVRTVYQYYHPPLHHILASVWLKIQTLIGIDFNDACENIQILTLFYSCCCMILSYKIFKALKLHDKGLVTALAVVAFCPTFYIMSGSINNDILSVTFMLGGILNTIYWYENPTLKRILCIAVCIGCGMMTKLSAWMIAPAVGFIFVYIFVKELKKGTPKSKHTAFKYFKQYVYFILVCAPLGLWWGIRNLTGWGVPIAYVMELSENSGQYVGEYSVVKRIFDFNPSFFADVGDAVEFYGFDYNEYNPLVGIFKTSMFDELFTVKFYPQIAVYNKILFWSAVIIGLLGFVSMVCTMIKPSKELNAVQKIFISLIYWVIFISYYVFCIKFPQVCTMNIRYAVPLIVVGAYFIGTAVQKLFSDEKKWKRICGMAVCLLCTVYSFFSYVCYTLIFMD